MEVKSSESLFWRNMYEELHAHTQRLLSQNISSAVDPLAHPPTHTSSSTIVASPATRPPEPGFALGDPTAMSIGTGDSEYVRDLHREIMSLRKTLHTVQQAKVDTESAWGGVARVESRIDNAWCVSYFTQGAEKGYCSKHPILSGSGVCCYDYPASAVKNLTFR